MGLVIPQVVTTDSASGAQVIDGSLNFFQESNPYLEFTPGSDGNRSTWTISFWAKVDPATGTTYNPFTLATSDSYSSQYEGLHYATNNLYYIDYISSGGGANILWKTNAKFRDTGWYHFMAVKVDNSTFKLYANKEELTDLATSTNNGNQSTYWNKSGQKMLIGGSPHATGYSSHSPGMSQFYFIDGQALTPDSFGFTDPLTNTWRPKKYTGTFTGTNTFYLPMDGNSPIGEDKSGNGNDWTPVNFGGSNSLEKATGARPILNTTQGGTQATVGVFGSRQNVGYAVTVFDDGGGNKYYIDGDKQATLTGLIRGATYTFDTSDSTLGSTHPFRLSATSAHGTEYTNGVVAVTGAATTITIPYNAPNALYYYCTSHSGMGSSITGITTNEKLADQYASNVTLALPLVGSDDDVCASIACTANNKTPTNSSVTAATTQSNFYSGSHYWNANTDSLLYAQSGNELVFGTDDFTIEFWFYDDNGHNGTSNRCVLFDNRRGGNVQGDPPQLVGWVDSHNEINLYYANGSTMNITVGTTIGKWWHYAAVRSGGTLKLYIDGVEVGSASDTTNYPNNGIALGSGTDSGYSWSGYIQDFRVYNGVAKYTSNFVPAATNPNILPDTPSGVSGSSKLTKITEGAVSFDGTGDRLTADIGSGGLESNFCVEYWIYADGITGDRGHFQISEQSGGLDTSNTSLMVSWGNSEGDTNMYVGNANVTDINDPNQNNVWKHYAVVRNSGTLKLYVNGKEAYSASNSVDMTSFRYVSISGYYSTSYLWKGFISNFRVVSGSPVYTSSFTPPTAPLTDITNTKLLCCQSNTSATAAAVSPGTITANGDAAATNFNPFNTDINAVRGQETAYPTLNPLDMRASTALSNGNLTVTGAGAAWYLARSTQFVSTGKYYWEYKWGGSIVDGSNGYQMGLKTPTSTLTAAAEQAGSYAFQYTSIYLTAGSLNTVVISPGSITPGDCVMFAYDADAGLMWFGVNGKWNDGANPASGTNSDWTSLPTTGLAPFAGVYGNTIKIDINFGQKPFKYAPPDGFQPINAANTRPVKVIPRSDQFVGIVTYTGDNSASKKIDDLSFSPDLVWVKDRGLNFTHFWNDTVRGAGKILQSNATTAETDNSDTIAAFPSFDPNGFTVGTNSNWQMNGNNEPYVGWCWKAGGSKNTFNVDDVGYASASDVGMNVGGQNSNAYNTSQIWSSTYAGSAIDGSYPITQAFDGNRSTAARVSALETVMSVALTNITVTNKIEVFGELGFNTPNVSVTVGGVTHNIGGDPSTAVGGSAGTTTKTITGVSGALTNVTVGKMSSGRSYLSQIIVDGKILVNSNITPPNAPLKANTGASVGTKQGFSIIKFTNDSTNPITLSHGLTQAPTFVLLKALTGTVGWTVGHTSIGFRKRLKLNGTDAESASANFFNDTAPTSSLITLGANNVSNDFIMYSWHDVPGLQKFGKYIGNANADGPFIELGFRPSVIIIKRSDGGTENWTLWDAARNPHNVMGKQLYPNLSSSEADAGTNSAYGILDFVSNGVKIRGSHTSFNSSGHTFIYAAWAEAPTVNLFGGSSNAR